MNKLHLHIVTKRGFTSQRTQHLTKTLQFEQLVNIWRSPEYKYILERLPNVSLISDGAPWFLWALSGPLPHLLGKSTPAELPAACVCVRWHVIFLNSACFKQNTIVIPSSSVWWYWSSSNTEWLAQTLTVLRMNKVPLRKLSSLCRDFLSSH